MGHEWVLYVKNFRTLFGIRSGDVNMQFNRWELRRSFVFINLMNFLDLTLVTSQLRVHQHLPLILMKLELLGSQLIDPTIYIIIAWFKHLSSAEDRLWTRFGWCKDRLKVKKNLKTWMTLMVPEWRLGLEGEKLGLNPLEKSFLPYFLWFLNWERMNILALRTKQVLSTLTRSCHCEPLNK